MTEKTNAQLYAELAEKLKEVDSKLKEIADFAEANQLVVRFMGAQYWPKSEEVRDEYGEGMEENYGPPDEYGDGDETKGVWWQPSTCW